MKYFGKAISWEMFSTVLTFGIAWLVTGSLRVSLDLAAVCFVIKVIFFTLHERLWNQ